LHGFASGFSTAQLAAFDTTRQWIVKSLSPAMPAFVHSLLNRWARRQTESRSKLSVAASARVNFRGIYSRPPGELTIGEGTIFEGRIASDRAGSCVVIGQHTFVGNSSIVTAERVEIGDDVLISWGCTIVDHDSHALSWAQRQGDVRQFYRGDKDWTHVNVRSVKICNKVWMGFNVIVLKGVTIGEGAVVAAGSVVTRDVPAFTLVAGNPARAIRSVKDGGGEPGQ
jgi:acetyltransferase-like isoleucine patch superfamily enzyme